MPSKKKAEIDDGNPLLCAGADLELVACDGTCLAFRSPGDADDDAHT